MCSCVFKNKEISLEDDTNKDDSTVLSLLEVIDSSCDDCDIDSDHCKEEVDITPFHSTNDTM